MNKQQEVMRLALEALEGGAESWQRVGPAIDALKAALAEPVQEPVAQALCEADRIMGHDDEATEWRERWGHLFKAPPQRPAEPQGCDHCNHPLYAAVKCKVCGRAT